MPSRSTNAPNSTMLEMTPSTTWPGWRSSRIFWRTSRRSSSRTARRESTTLFRFRLSSMTLHSSLRPRNSSRSWTRRMSTSEAGRKPRTPRSRIRPPLTTSMTVPSTCSPAAAAASMRFHAFSKRARFLERIRRPSWSSFCMTRASTHLAEGDLVVGLDALADRQLGQRDDALALVADVDQDLVLVDPDHPPGDDVPLREEREGEVVVRHHARRRPRCTRGRRGRGPGCRDPGASAARGSSAPGASTSAVASSGWSVVMGMGSSSLRIGIPGTADRLRPCGRRSSIDPSDPAWRERHRGARELRRARPAPRRRSSGPPRRPARARAQAAVGVRSRGPPGTLRTGSAAARGCSARLTRTHLPAAGGALDLAGHRLAARAARRGRAPRARGPSPVRPRSSRTSPSAPPRRASSRR